MDEVRIWAVDGDSGVVPLRRRDRTDTESLLEDILVRNPDLLIPGLRLVGRQTPTEGGPLDLLGVDGDGRLAVWTGRVGIVFYSRAKALCPDAFRQPVQEIGCDTYPKDRKPLEDRDAEIIFKCTAEQWEQHRERLSALTKAVYGAWLNSVEQESVAAAGGGDDSTV